MDSAEKRRSDAFFRLSKGPIVKHQSLSVILPVNNAEATLVNQVEELLDVLPELTSDFEIMIVDDGSTDDTPDIASELAARYPQIQLLRHEHSQGHCAAAEEGVARTSGDVIFVNERSSGICIHDLQRLWKLRSDDELVSARSRPITTPQQTGVIQRLVRWGHQFRDSLPEASAGNGIQMIRRKAVEEIAAENTPADYAQADPDSTPTKPSSIRPPTFSLPTPSTTMSNMLD